MSEILFIRHAATDMAGTFCGHSDPEINALGYEQIAELTEKIRSEDIGIVYSSDLRRAQTTAGAVTKAFGVEYHIRPELREMPFMPTDGWLTIRPYRRVEGSVFATLSGACSTK